MPAEKTTLAPPPPPRRPVQLPLDIAVPPSRPLLPLEFLLIALEKQEDEILMLIESGLLSHAWDIRGPGAKRRSEIRVWRTSLVRFVNGIGPGPDSETEDVVLDSLFSHSRPELRSTELQRLLAASQNHIATLIESKCLTGLNPPSPGPNGYVRVTRSSVVEFLRARRIT